MLHAKPINIKTKKNHQGHQDRKHLARQCQPKLTLIMQT